MTINKRIFQLALIFIMLVFANTTCLRANIDRAIVHEILEIKFDSIDGALVYFPKKYKQFCRIKLYFEDDTPNIYKEKFKFTIKSPSGKYYDSLWANSHPEGYIEMLFKSDEFITDSYIFEGIIYNKTLSFQLKGKILPEDEGIFVPKLSK